MFVHILSVVLERGTVMSSFTHFDNSGAAFMVDVGGKNKTEREAVASGKITMSEECFNQVMEGSIGKGDVLGIARIAGIMGTKKTSDLIPLCHSISITKSEIEFKADRSDFSIYALCKTKTVERTGVEMEALTGVTTALLTIYDMCKAVDRSMEITDVHLVKKSGGKSGVWERQQR